MWRLQHTLQRSTNIPFFWIIILRNVLLVLTVTHLFATIFFFIANYSYYYDVEISGDEAGKANFEESSWFGIDPAEIKEWGAFEKYVRSMYWSMATFATVGYGDISPVTTAEQVYTVVRPAAAGETLCRRLL